MKNFKLAVPVVVCDGKGSVIKKFPLYIPLQCEEFPRAGDSITVANCEIENRMVEFLHLKIEDNSILFVSGMETNREIYASEYIFII